MVDIKFILEEKRAVAFDDGKEIGEATFVDHNGTWIVNHTYVNNTYRGQGIANKLVDMVYENALKNNKKLGATCSYAVRIYSQDDKYKDIYVG